MINNAKQQEMSSKRITRQAARWRSSQWRLFEGVRVYLDGWWWARLWPQR